MAGGGAEGGQGALSVSPPAKWLVRVASWFLGLVFICAGALKMADPLAFADSVASFQLLPGMMINPKFRS